MTLSPAIRVSGVSCRFGHVTALRDVALEIPPGTVTALVGPNGAGKTTLLRILSTLARPSSGSVLVAGHDTVSDADAVRRRIGFVGHSTWLYPDLTAVENLRFHGRLHAIDDAEARIRALLERAGLVHRRHDRCRTFSRGTAQRLAISRALLHEPTVMLLDEPYTGLDQHASATLDHTLRAVADAGHTVLLATHDLARVSTTSDRVVLLAEGVVVWQGATASLPTTDVAGWYREQMDDARRAGVSTGAPAVHAGADAADIASATAAEAAGAQTTTIAKASVGETSASPAPGSQPRTAAPWDVMRAILWKDFTVEWRARESVPPVLVFALLVTVIFQFVLPQDGYLRSEAAPGVLWVALLFGSTLGFARLLGAEVDSGGLTALAVSPVDRGAVFAGKWLAAFLFSLLVAAILLPAIVVLLGLTLSASTVLMLGAIAAVALVGWSATGVMLGTIAVSARAREVLLPVLLYPLVLPLVVPAVTASGTVIRGDPYSDLLAPLVLILAYDVIFWVMGFLLYGYVMED